MYAEGDTLLAGDEEANLLSQTLENVVKKLKKDNEMYMPLFYFIFDKEISKFQTTKWMTKGVKEKPDLDQQEESEDEFSESSAHEQVSS